MSYCFKIIILAEICIKIRYFIEKLQKSLSAGAPLPDPLAYGGWKLCPQPSASGG